MKHKYAILSALVLIVPFLVYVLWMMYGWIFFDVHFGGDEFNKTMSALTGLFFGALITWVVNLYER